MISRISSLFRPLFSLLTARQAGLQARVLRGGAWLIAADILSRILGLLKMVVLARLLAPADFGLIGLASVVIAWFEYFTQTGFSLALVRKQGDIGPYLNTFWTVQALRGFIVAGVVFAGSPLVAWMFGNAELVPVTRALSLLLFLRGLANPAVVYLRKELRIEREVAWRLGGAFVGAAVAIPLALAYRNVWPLVISVLAGAFAELVLSYCLIVFRPRFELNWGKARELMTFGKWVFWNNAVAYLNQYADTWIVGRFLGAVPVGYYQLAQQSGALPLTQVGAHISAVVFPAFAKLQDAATLRGAFLRAFRFASTVLLPPAVMLAVFAPDFVRLVFGERWIPVAPLLRILVLGSAVVALGSVSRALLQATNRPRLPAQASCVKFLSFAILVYPLMQQYGAPGVALAVMLSSPVAFGYQYFETARLLGWNWDFVLVFRHAAVACLPALAAALFLPLVQPPWNLAVVAAALLACLMILFRELRTVL